MVAYYNEIDPFAAAWLRELIAAGHIAPGDVDERSIVDLRPDDLRGYTQCHFFAGIGVWSYALRRAGWADSTPVWTGSCPCQPFSAAGKGEGFADERHLWPHFHYLIEQCQPAVVLGEQVASKDGLAWLDLVQADMEATRYAFGAVDTCAAGFGAPHIRQRLYWIGEWLADTEMRRQSGGLRERGSAERAEGSFGGHGAFGRLADAGSRGSATRVSEPLEREEGIAREHDDHCRERDGGEIAFAPAHPRPTNGLWRDADWLFCRDGKWRPVESGTFPLAHGAAARVGRLRGYGNAINAEQAQGFIEAVIGSINHA